MKMRDKIKYTLLEHIILEGRLEDTIKKYSQKLPEPVIRELSQNDPSGNNKYLDWMVRTVAQSPNEKNDVITKVKCYHESVNRLSENHAKAIYEPMKKERGATQEHINVIDKIIKSPKDINSYPSHHWIKPMCDYFEEQKPRNASRIKLYEDEKWLVVAPLTHAASCSYGAHSNWCVSTTNADYYARYMKDGILVFVLDKKGFNKLKPDANIYKFAVNINHDHPDMTQWHWYSMEDHQQDALLMMNLVPKQILSVIEKYYAEVVKQLGFTNNVDEKELEEKSLAWYRNGSNYYVFLNTFDKNWEDINTAADWLAKYNGGQLPQLKNYKPNGYPYVTLNARVGRRPTLNTNNLNWSPILTLRQSDNTVPKSMLFMDNQGFNDRYHGANRTLNFLPDEKRMLVYDAMIDLFNKAEITKNQRVYTNQLNVGDRIIYRPHGRTWGQGETVSVIRVTDKSLVLSNGKRIGRTATSVKDRVMGVSKVVDDTVKSESRWVRKRII